MTIDVLERIHADQADGVELAQIGLQHFGSAKSGDKGVLAFPSTGDPTLTLRFEGRTIAEAAARDGGALAEVDSLADVVAAALLDHQTDQIAANIGFASRPVDASWAAPNGSFQIVPAPADAPRPPMAAGRHPFVLEYHYVQSSNGAIDNQRRNREFARWIAFMNAALTDHISMMSPRMRHFWGICPDWDSDSLPETRWAQEFYGVDGFNFIPGLFSQGAATIAPVPAASYYARQGIQIGEPLDVPDSFPETIHQYVSLSGDAAVRFERAARWRSTANHLWEVSISSWYTALVTAIETLAFVKRPRADCPNCGRDQSEKPTADFKDFLERYAPDAGRRRDFDTLYSVRSQLVHGAHLLDADEPSGFGFLSFATNEQESLDRLSMAMTVVMVNWLKDQA